MECLSMNYKFTAILIIMMTLLALFGGPAHSRNEYLTNGTNSCRTGEVDVRIETENRDNDYRHNSSSNDYDNNSDNDRLSVTYRHYIGTACTKQFRKVQQENMELKQQLELMKMCGKVNNNPSILQNSNFSLLVSKCTGVTATENNRPESKSYWDSLVEEHKNKPENKSVEFMGTKNILKMPPKDFDLPEPTND